VVWSLPISQVRQLQVLVHRLEGDTTAANTRAEAMLAQVST
jgi:hypothetical protein